MLYDGALVSAGVDISGDTRILVCAVIEAGVAEVGVVFDGWHMDAPLQTRAKVDVVENIFISISCRRMQ